MILMNDFKSEPLLIRQEMLAAASRVIDSGWYILGKELSAFEALWAKTCGTTHAIGTGNGMDAIEIALRALGIKAGDEVITTPMTAFASVLAIIRAGAVPVLADINPDTAILCQESARRAITPRTRAILLVHLYGQIADMDTWVTLCEEKGIALVEDCAQAHLASWQGKVAGSFGRAGAYSFYPTKNLGAPGDAGALVTNDAAIAALASQLRNYGQEVRYHHPLLGMNSRLDEMQAAMLSVRLKWLEEFTIRRREIASFYHAGINNPLVQPLRKPEHEAAHSYHLFVICCEKRDALQAHLKASGIESLIHYPVPIHQQKPCTDIARDPAGLGNSEKHADLCLSIPCHPQLSQSDMETVTATINSFRAE